MGAFDETASGASAVLDRLARLNAGLSFGPTASLMVLIESVVDFTGTEAESEVAQLVKALADASAFVIGEAEASVWSQALTLAQPFKSARRGLLLAPGGVEADTLLNTPIGTILRNDFPPGRGVLVEKGKGVWIQSRSRTSQPSQQPVAVIKKEVTPWRLSVLNVWLTAQPARHSNLIRKPATFRT